MKVTSVIESAIERLATLKKTPRDYPAEAAVLREIADQLQGQADLFVAWHSVSANRKPRKFHQRS